MLSLPPASRIHICHQPQDMRKSFDGLAAATFNLLGQTATSGHYFVFLSRRRKLIKILSWEGDGHAIWSKRLEQGQFNPPKTAKREIFSGRGSSTQYSPPSGWKISGTGLRITGIMSYSPAK